MGTGQTLMALVALTILATVTISANKLVLNRTDIVLQSEAMITGTAVGQAMIEQITVKRFDQNLPPPLTTDDVDDLSQVLGPDQGENPLDPSTFNDIDDYNGYRDSVLTPRLGYFWRTCSVYYVTENSPDANAGPQTFLKRIDVTVKNPYIATQDSSIKLSKIVSYRYKD